jgi:hypothetical protein
MIRHKPSGPKCDSISSITSFGKSFINLCSPTITDGSEDTSFLLLFDSVVRQKFVEFLVHGRKIEFRKNSV